MIPGLDERPLIVAVAGPNGAGKSTFFEAQLQATGLPFINADVLARALGIDAYVAAALAEKTREDFVARGESFVFETVLSDPVGEKVEFLSRAARERGYRVILCFIGLDSAAASNQRVALRVKQGGHGVPTAKLAARYPRTLANLKRALAVLPVVLVYDNSVYEQPHRFVAEYRDGIAVRTGDGPPPTWFAEVIQGA